MWGCGFVLARARVVAFDLWWDNAQSAALKSGASLRAFECGRKFQLLHLADAGKPFWQVFWLDRGGCLLFYVRRLSTTVVLLLQKFRLYRTRRVPVTVGVVEKEGFLGGQAVLRLAGSGLDLESYGFHRALLVAALAAEVQRYHRRRLVRLRVHPSTFAGGALGARRLISGEGVVVFSGGQDDIRLGLVAFA